MYSLYRRVLWPSRGHSGWSYLGRGPRSRGEPMVWAWDTWSLSAGGLVGVPYRTHTYVRSILLLLLLLKNTSRSSYYVRYRVRPVDNLLGFERSAVECDQRCSSARFSFVVIAARQHRCQPADRPRGVGAHRRRQRRRRRFFVSDGCPADRPPRLALPAYRRPTPIIVTVDRRGSAAADVTVHLYRRYIPLSFQQVGYPTFLYYVHRT